jgi:peptidoglycan/xylan/chitin deacetylase (PgdA/CDA1 family)
MRISRITQSLQLLTLYVIRSLGGFSLARYLTRRRLRILCYHGFSIGDEFTFLPHMFMRAGTFEKRMGILKRWRLPVLRLDEAVRRLRAKTINSAEIAITFDDGWASNLTIGLPILDKHGYPVCIYVTTEHLAAGTQAFNVALYYMIRRSGRTTVVFSGVHPGIDGSYEVGADPRAAVARLIDAAERACTLDERQRLLRPIASALGLDFDEIFKDGRFTFLDAEQIRELAHRGVDIELHTHTHRLPHESFEAMSLEISRNREKLEALTRRQARHFCYPSGEYRANQAEWLERLGLASATTCDPGLNDEGTSPMFLKRYLDSELTPDIVFEAEVCGLHDVYRGIRATLFGNDRHDSAGTGEASLH